MLHAGKVYRREDLALVSNAVDRHLRELVSGGALKRLAQGLYYAPKKSAFGVLPPDDQELVATFLRDKDFLVFSPSSYNTLGLGTSQLYNKTLVYNHKRHGLFSFGNLLLQQFTLVQNHFLADNGFFFLMIFLGALFLLLILAVFGNIDHYRHNNNHYQQPHSVP